MQKIIDAIHKQIKRHAAQMDLLNCMRDNSENEEERHAYETYAMIHKYKIDGLYQALNIIKEGGEIYYTDL